MLLQSKFAQTGQNDETDFGVPVTGVFHSCKTASWQIPQVRAWLSCKAKFGRQVCLVLSLLLLSGSFIVNAMESPQLLQPANNGPDVHQPISAHDGIFGVRPQMSRLQLTALWGQPLAEFQLTSSKSLLAFAIDLWVVLGRRVEVVMLGGEPLTVTGQQLLGGGPDLRAWRGAQGLSADLRLNWPGRSGWQRAGRGIWLQQSGNNRLLLKLFEDKPAIVWLTADPIIGLVQPPLPSRLSQLQSAPEGTVERWLEQWEINRLNRGAAPAPMPLALQLHQLRCSCEQPWMLPVPQVQFRRSAQGQQLRLSSALFAAEPDLLAQYLQQLQLPGSKAGFVQLFADLQDAGDRIEVHRPTYSLVVDFTSDRSNAMVRQLTIRHRPVVGGPFINVGLH